LFGLFQFFYRHPDEQTLTKLIFLWGINPELNEQKEQDGLFLTGLICERERGD
jgi:hypothetical protein